jgi:thiosulfate/3-mercaptopyruvate sulfurtransferase
MSGPLIAPEDLAANSAHATVLDVRWALGGPPGREEYEQGHIPNAVFVDLEAELAAPAGRGGRHPLPSDADFQASMRRAGVDNDRAVIVYDTGSLAAARAWWLLRYFGHRDVVVLDGGLAGWSAAGFSLSNESPAPQPGNFVARAGGMPVLNAERAAALAMGGVLLDARAPERFSGEAEPIDPVAGHIPGAHNVPATLTVDATGKFRDATVLRDLFKDAGVETGVEVGAYCGSGVTAAHEVLALAIAGYRAALYPGSWSEWITDPRRPVARGV